MVKKIHIYKTPDPFSDLLLESENGALIRIRFIETSDFIEEEDRTCFGGIIRWLDLYFAGHKPNFTPRLSWKYGTPFQQEVWKELLMIPYNTVTSYKKKALKMNRAPSSSQAVGQAISKNPFMIVIPCHRVVKSDGSLSGYAGGIQNKKRLLEHEKKTG